MQTKFQGSLLKLVICLLNQYSKRLLTELSKNKKFFVLSYLFLKFLKIRNLSFSDKLWTIQFLIPWSEYIDLAEGVVMKEFKEGVFLEQTFSLTGDIAKQHQHYPHELILFWQGLSKG